MFQEGSVSSAQDLILGGRSWQCGWSAVGCRGLAGGTDRKLASWVQDGCDVFIFLFSEQDPGSTVLNVLQSLDVLAGEVRSSHPVWRRQRCEEFLSISQGEGGMKSGCGPQVEESPSSKVRWGSVPTPRLLTGDDGGMLLPGCQLPTSNMISNSVLNSNFSSSVFCVHFFNWAERETLVPKKMRVHYGPAQNFLCGEKGLN